MPARRGDHGLGHAARHPEHQHLDELDATTFATSRQTLYLLSKDGAGAAAPLVAALTDRILRAATRAAEAAGGRLDPPLLVVLDEAANICRISDLPELYSHFGSRGITPITILQSYKQGVRVWGEHGMDALWSAATVKLIGPGLDDARLAEDLSRLVGDHDVPVRSINHGDRQHRREHQPAPATHPGPRGHPRPAPRHRPPPRHRLQGRAHRPCSLVDRRKGRDGRRRGAGRPATADGTSEPHNERGPQ